MRHTSLLVALLLTLGACAAPSAPERAAGDALVDGKADDGSGVVTPGSPEALAILAFVNDEGTSFEELDVAVGLDRRAARKIVKKRPFGSIAELDDVPYVGPVAMQRLLTYVTDLGMLPPPNADLAGTFDGVPFTHEQAVAALRLVNEESDGVLRYEVGLTSTATGNIVDARPILDVAALAAVPYVGPVSLTKIRDFAEPPPVEGGSWCRHDGECPGDLQCLGIPNDGSTDEGFGPRGKCRDVAPVEGQGASCESHGDCGDGLICVGLFAYGSGWCEWEWLGETFEVEGTRHIEADQAFPAVFGFTVAGHLTVPVDLVVTTDVAYSPNADLRLTLTNPTGVEYTIFDGATDPASKLDAPITVGAFGDETVNGGWMLRLYNAGGSSVGTWNGASIYLTSRWD
jgi:DNA uptake protein ComE-like DNA-binding protein